MSDTPLGAPGAFALAMLFAWNALVIGGCAYVVFWRDHSPWWFLLAVILLAWPEGKTT